MPFSVRRFPAAAASAALLTAVLISSGCGGSSGGPSTPPPPTVLLSGTVTFDFVPVTAEGGLDYAASTARPARGVVVELVADGSVVGDAVTDSQGRYSLQVPQNRNAHLRARAEMRRTGAGGWQARVVDNTAGNAIHGLEGAPFHTGTTALSEDLHAASGWDGAAYGSEREAASFAILDVVHDAMAFVQQHLPGTTFPPLTIHWSPDNLPVLGPDGVPDLAAGEIGTSFYAPGVGMFLLGAENDDTDEYDRHVVAHEWAHYYEHAFSRTDSPGGPHALGDQLDPRVAFSEGWANAFAALVAGDPLYRDSLGPGQGSTFSFDLRGEGLPLIHPGWFSEQSVHELLYALFGPGDGGVAPAIDFTALAGVLTGPLRNSEPQTSIFAFLEALKAARPGADAVLIDSVAESRAISPDADRWGDGESNAGHPADADVLPVHAPLTVGLAPVNVCSTDRFTSPLTGAVNKLASRQFLRVDIPFAGRYAVTSQTTSVPSGHAASPGVIVHRRGRIAAVEPRPGEACSAATAPAACVTQLVRELEPGEHVIEVHEWTNAQPDPAHPPVGRTCFDVSIAFDAAGKPAGLFALDHELLDAPAAGVPLSLRVRAQPRVAVAGLVLSAQGDGQLTLTGGWQSQPTDVGAGDMIELIVTVLLQPQGRQHLMVLASGRVGERRQAETLRIALSP